MFVSDSYAFPSKEVFLSKKQPCRPSALEIRVSLVALGVLLGAIALMSLFSEGTFSLSFTSFLAGEVVMGATLLVPNDPQKSKESQSSVLDESDFQDEPPPLDFNNLKQASPTKNAVDSMLEEYNLEPSAFKLSLEG